MILKFFKFLALFALGNLFSYLTFISPINDNIQKISHIYIITNKKNYKKCYNYIDVFQKLDINHIHFYVIADISEFSINYYYIINRFASYLFNNIIKNYKNVPKITFNLYHKNKKLNELPQNINWNSPLHDNIIFAKIKNSSDIINLTKFLP